MKPDVRQHGHFYSLCQAVFYVFIFRHKELLEMEGGVFVCVRACVCACVCVGGWGVKEWGKTFFFSIFRQKFFTADEPGENRLLSFESFESEFSSKVQSQDLFLIGQRSHDLCLHTVTLCTSVGLSSHSRRNVCIFDKASNTQCIIYTLSSSKYLSSLPLPTHTAAMKSCSAIQFWNKTNVSSLRLRSPNSPHMRELWGLPTLHTQTCSTRSSRLIHTTWKGYLSLILLRLEHHGHNITISIV